MGTFQLTAVPYAAATEVTTNVNLIRDPRCSSASAFWASFPGAGGGVANLTVQTPPSPMVDAATGEPLPSTTRLVHTQTTASTGPAGAFISTAVGTIVPGLAYHASVYFASSTGFTFTARLVFKTAAGAAIGAAFVGAPVVGAAAALGYQRLTVAAVAPATASYVTLEIYSVGAMAVGALVFTCARIGLGTPILPYIDGSLRAPVGQLYSWESTPGASATIHRTRTVGAGSVQLTTEYLLDMPETRESATVLHDVIARADPVPAFGVLRSRTGTLTFLCETYADAERVIRLHETARTVLLVSSATAGRSMYYVATRIGNAVWSGSDDKVEWQVSIDYRETYQTAVLW